MGVEKREIKGRGAISTRVVSKNAVSLQTPAPECLRGAILTRDGHDASCPLAHTVVPQLKEVRRCNGEGASIKRLLQAARKLLKALRSHDVDTSSCADLDADVLRFVAQFAGEIATHSTVSRLSVVKDLVAMILEPLPHDIAISALFSLVDAVYDTTQTITSKEQAIEWTELAHVIGPIDAVSSVLATPFPQLMRRHTVFEFACITLKEAARYTISDEAFPSAFFTQDVSLLAQFVVKFSSTHLRQVLKCNSEAVAEIRCCMRDLLRLLHSDALPFETRSIVALACAQILLIGGEVEGAETDGDSAKNEKAAALAQSIAHSLQKKARSPQNDQDETGSSLVDTIIGATTAGTEPRLLLTRAILAQAPPILLSSAVAVAASHENGGIKEPLFATLLGRIAAALEASGTDGVSHSFALRQMCIAAATKAFSVYDTIYASFYQRHSGRDGSCALVMRFADILWRLWRSGVDVPSSQMVKCMSALMRAGERAAGDNDGVSVISAVLARAVEAELHLKGKYVALECIVPLYGADRFFREYPSVISDLFDALATGRIASHAAKVLQKLSGPRTGITADLWAEAVSKRLLSGTASTARNVAAYALQEIMQGVDGVFEKTMAWLKGAMPHQADKAFYSCLLCLQAVIQIDSKRSYCRPIEVVGDAMGEAGEKVLSTGVGHLLPEVRVVALELVTLPFKQRKQTKKGFNQRKGNNEMRDVETADKRLNGDHGYPTEAECAIIMQFITGGLKDMDEGYRHDVAQVMGRFFKRLRHDVIAARRKRDEASYQRLVHWMASALLRIGANMYASAPHPRSACALSVLSTCLFDAWEETVVLSPTLVEAGRSLCEMLLSGLWDTYDLHRLQCLAALQRIPEVTVHTSTTEGDALQSISLADVVEKHRDRFCNAVLPLLRSPRVRECDVGSMMVLLLQSCGHLDSSKNVAQDVFDINSYPADAPVQKWFPLPPGASHPFSLLCYLLRTAERLFATHPMHLHGLFLCMRRVIAAAEMSLLKRCCGWREWSTRLLELITRVSDNVMEVVGDISPEGYDSSSTASGSPYCISAAGDVTPDNIALLKGNADENDSMEGSTSDQRSGDVARSARTMLHSQSKAVASWLSIKESSLLAATLLERVPHSASIHPVQGENHLIAAQATIGFGEWLLEVMLRTKHKGALEKAFIALERMTKALLQSACEAVRSLPRKWIDVLLKKVLDDPVRAITRRSAGLPFAFTAIFRAEVQSEKFISCHSLLPTSVEAFLSAMENGLSKEGETDDNVKERQVLALVHSFNVSRALAKDKMLARELAPYMERICLSSIQCLSSSSWAVRNVAALCLSASVTRLLGHERSIAAQAAASEDADGGDFSIEALHNSDQSSRGDIARPEGIPQSSDGQSNHYRERGTGFCEFFSSYPKLYSAILQELENAAAGVMGTSLFASLVFLSRLSPPSTGSSQSPACLPLSPQPFIPPLLNLCKHRDGRVRLGAARALPSVVPIDDAGSFLQQITEDVRVDALNAYRVHNEVHGRLLQGLSLLKAHSHDANEDASSSWLSAEHRQRILSSLCDALIPLLNGHCYPVIAELMTVFDNLLPYYCSSDPRLRTCATTIHKNVLELALPPGATFEELQNELSPHHFVMREKYRASATLFLLNWMEGCVSMHQNIETSGEFWNFMSRQVADEDALVRVEVLQRVIKTAKEHVRRRRGGSDGNLCAESRLRSIVEVISAQLQQEKHHLCQQRSLCAIRMCLKALQHGHAFSILHELSSMWETPMKQLAEGVSTNSTRCEAVRLASFAAYHSTVASLPDHQWWAEIVREMADETALVSDRYTAAMAIIESGVLQPIPLFAPSDVSPGTTRLQLWITALQLLDDDDQNIRCRMAKAIGMGLQHSAWERLDKHKLEITYTFHEYASLSLNYPAVCKQSHEQLTSHLLSSSRHVGDALLEVWRKYLLETVRHVGPNWTGTAQGEDGNVFPPEPPNFWIDPLVRVSLCCRCLQDMIVEGSTVSLEPRTWLANSVDELRVCAESLPCARHSPAEQSDAEVTVIPAVNAVCFHSLYARAVAVLVSGCAVRLHGSVDRDRFEKAVHALEALKPLHPLLENLLCRCFDDGAGRFKRMDLPADFLNLQ